MSDIVQTFEGVPVRVPNFGRYSSRFCHNSIVLNLKAKVEIDEDGTTYVYITKTGVIQLAKLRGLSRSQVQRFCDSWYLELLSPTELFEVTGGLMGFDEEPKLVDVDISNYTDPFSYD
jgi:hypothetical protein